MTNQFADYSIASKGRSFEEFHSGQILEHHWGRTITESDAELFSINTCNWVPQHFNREFAVAEGHADVPVSPAFLLTLAVGLSVEDLSEAGGPFLGLDDVTFHRPVYPGSTVYASSIVIDVRLSGSRPDYGIVTWETTLREGFDGEDVLTYRRTNLVRRNASDTN